MINVYDHEQLKILRNGKKLREVANATGISISYLSDLENGRTYPSLEKLLSLAYYYQVEIGRFFRCENKPASKTVRQGDE